MENDADAPTLIRMSPDAYADFIRLIERPGEPVPKLVEIMRRKAPWEVQSAGGGGGECKSPRSE